MPLIKSKLDAAFKSNLKAEMAAGKPQKQALAIAYSVKRRSRARGGMADGGDPSAIDTSNPISAFATGPYVSDADTVIPPRNPMGDVGSSIQQRAGNVASALGQGALQTGKGMLYPPQMLTPEERNARMADVALASPLPEAGLGALGRGIGAIARSAPKTAAGTVAGLGLLGSTAGAGDVVPDQMPQITQQQTDRINQLQKLIDRQQNKMNDSLSSLSRKDRASSPVAKPYLDAIAGAQREMDGIHADVKSQQDDWRAKQEQAAEVKHQAEMPFYERYPTINSLAPFAGVVGGALSGSAAGMAAKAYQAGKAEEWAQRIAKERPFVWAQRMGKYRTRRADCQ